MTVEEIFNKIISHMIEGIMFHDEMAKAFDFLGLWGYAKCQDYHHFEEECNYRHFSHYYATHYFRLLQVENIPKPKLIPDTWYKYQAQSVDSATKRSAIKDLMKNWSEWERATKKLYQEMYQELYNLGEVAAASELDYYIKDVTKELHNVEKQIITLESINYDIIHIIEEQKPLSNKYKKKLGW